MVGIVYAPMCITPVAADDACHLTVQGEGDSIYRLHWSRPWSHQCASGLGLPILWLWVEMLYVAKVNPGIVNPMSVDRTVVWCKVKSWDLKCGICCGLSMGDTG